MAIVIDSVLPSGLFLDEFREFASFDPLTFTQMDWQGCNDCPVETPPCLWWVQHIINDPIMNRELLARHLCECAEELRIYLGTFATPSWTSEDIPFPDFWMSDRPYIQPWGFMGYKFQTNCWGIKQFGQPLYTNHDDVQVDLEDKDGDGITETATIEFQLPANIELDQLRFYFNDRKCGDNEPDPHYEIGPVEKMQYDSDTNEVTVTFYSWNIVQPDLYTPHTWKKAGPISACEDVYEDTIEVWSETKDICKPEIEVIWNTLHCEDCGGTGCNNCETITKFACARPVDLCEGIFNFSLIGEDEEGCPDPTATCIDAPCRRPDRIRFHYLAGEESKAAKRALFLLASSKYLIASNCECDCVKNVLGTYSQSLINRNQDGKNPWTNISFNDIAELPFAPTLGAMLAYKILKEIKENRCC